MLTLEKIKIRGALVPKEIPIVAKVGQFSEWPVIIVDVYTKEESLALAILNHTLKTQLGLLIALLKLPKIFLKIK